MTTLAPYIARKAGALAQRRADCAADPSKGTVNLKAVSRVAGATGIRPTEMGKHSIITDAAPGLGGYGLGPTAPELLLGALASCLVHTYLIEAALNDIPLEHVEIEVNGRLDMTGVFGLPCEEPSRLSDVTYQARIESPAAPDQIERLHARVETSCPVLNTLRTPVNVTRA